MADTDAVSSLSLMTTHYEHSTTTCALCRANHLLHNGQPLELGDLHDYNALGGFAWEHPTLDEDVLVQHWMNMCAHSTKPLLLREATRDDVAWHVHVNRK